MKFVFNVIRIGALIALGVLVLMLIISAMKNPRAERDWSEEFSRTMTAQTAPDGTVRIENVRDWTYTDATILSKDWREVTVDPATITQVWFVTEPFSSWKAVGHTFLSFEFADGTVLSFSIEARREEGEDYSALRGLFNTYELAYQWGTERDFITRRLLYLDHPVRRYPLALSPGTAQGLFLGAIERTNALAVTPRFYNTLTENCTNALAYIVNEITPDTLPYDLSWQLTGYADLYLMKQKFIPVLNASKEATREAYDLTKFKTEVRRVATTSPKAFSATLTTVLQQQ